MHIHRSPQGISFGIYRKPTSTDMYTHFFSAHPMATKKGVLIGLFLRALRLCSNEHLATEIDHIFKAFTRLHYPKYIIHQTLTTARSRFLHPADRQRPRTKYHLKLPCHPALQTLRPALSKIGVSTSYSSSNTLRSHLRSNASSVLRVFIMVKLVFL